MSLPLLLLGGGGGAIMTLTDPAQPADAISSPDNKSFASSPRVRVWQW